MKLCFVAPTDPSKGAVGIITYVSRLTSELSKRYEITLISFKKLYPHILNFPDNRSPISHKTYKTLSTYFPPTWSRASTLIRHFEPDLIQFHWWTSILNPTYIYLLKTLKRYKTVVMCHNPVSHEHSLIFRSLDQLNGLMFALTDQIIVNTVEAKEAIIKMHTKLKDKVIVIPHGNLIYQNSARVSSPEAKSRLGVNPDKPCLLFFGYIRKYKGLSYLLMAIRGVNCSLIIAGKFIEPLDNYTKLIESMGIEDQVKIFPHFIPDSLVPLLFKAADIVVLPYVNFSSASGIAHIAMGFGKCIVATRCPGFNEMFEHNMSAYLVPPCNSASLRRAIIELIHSPTQMQFMGRNARNLSQSYDWNKIANMHVVLYRRLLE